MCAWLKNKHAITKSIPMMNSKKYPQQTKRQRNARCMKRCCERKKDIKCKNKEVYIIGRPVCLENTVICASRVWIARRRRGTEKKSRSRNSKKKERKFERVQILKI